MQKVWLHPARQSAMRTAIQAPNPTLPFQVGFKTFTRPADFELEGHLQNSLGVCQTNAPLTEVRIRFSAEVARYVTEHRWHHSQQIEEQPDGSLVVVPQLSDLTEIKSWVLSFGAQARVLTPESLRETVQRELTESLAAYTKKDATQRRSPTTSGKGRANS